jgi:hypothetical protein
MKRLREREYNHLLVQEYASFPIRKQSEEEGIRSLEFSTNELDDVSTYSTIEQAPDEPDVFVKRLRERGYNHLIAQD